MSQSRIEWTESTWNPLTGRAKTRPLFFALQSPHVQFPHRLDLRLWRPAQARTAQAIGQVPATESADRLPAPRLEGTRRQRRDAHQEFDSHRRGFVHSGKTHQAGPRAGWHGQGWGDRKSG